MAEHTATPWRRACFQIYAADKSRIAHTGMGQLPPHRSSESEANAAFIVKAANNHDELVSTLQFLLEVLEIGCVQRGADHANAKPDSAIGRARAVLARVGREQHD